MSSWRQESEAYKARMYEKYGIIEEKFDKQAFNEDPIAYFESIDYKLHGTEWISAMWNLLKLAHTDSRFLKKQLGPNGQKVAYILCKILNRNPALEQQVEAKANSNLNYGGADAVLNEYSLAKYERLLDDDVLNEGLKDWWKNLSTKKKVGIIVTIIAILLITFFSIVGANNGANEVFKNASTFGEKIKAIANYPIQGIKSLTATILGTTPGGTEAVTDAVQTASSSGATEAVADAIQTASSSGATEAISNAVQTASSSGATEAISNAAQTASHAWRGLAGFVSDGVKSAAIDGATSSIKLDVPHDLDATQVKNIFTNLSNYLNNLGGSLQGVKEIVLNGEGADEFMNIAKNFCNDFGIALTAV